jgi:hypothetical protein
MGNILDTQRYTGAYIINDEIIRIRTQKKGKI